LGNLGNQTKAFLIFLPKKFFLGRKKVGLSGIINLVLKPTRPLVVWEGMEKVILWKQEVLKCSPK